MASKPHRHTPKDGRGFRKVFVNGNPIDHVFYADTKRGIALAFCIPLRPHPHRHRGEVRWHCVKGRVTVAPLV